MSLSLSDVRLTYPDGQQTVTALDGVSLHVRSGELAAVVGPSGSGKSSALAVAATLQQPDSGRVRVNGVTTTRLSSRELGALRRDQIGIVFQQPNLISSLSAAEQLLVTEHMRGRSPRRNRQRARELLSTVGLDGKQHRRPHQLSGGERQRVNIARALVGEPSVLLVDEPTAALDHDRGGQIVQLLAEVTRQYELATVMVTHDTEYLDLVGSVSTLRDGRMVHGHAVGRH